MGVCRKKGKYLKAGIGHLFNFRYLLQIIFGAAVMNWVQLDCPSACHGDVVGTLS